jgi:hypothetical protein
VKNLSYENRGRPGRTFKGGVTSYAKIERDVRHQLRNKPGARAITTMIDYYGLPADFPGLDSLPIGNAYERVTHLERAFGINIDSWRFRPFLMLHEFEALLFTDTSQIAAVFHGQTIAGPLEAIREAFNSPEEINEGQATHPSARIMTIVTGYRKPLHGSLISQRIGLSAFREQCPHFGEWVTWLESLSD